MTWWTDHLTIWPSNIFLLTFPWNISLSKRQNLSHPQAHELVESLWRSGVEPVILGNRVSRRFVVCWLCVVNIQFCTIFEVGACCSMHLTSFDKKIPFELLSYLGWSFHQRGQFPTTNGSAKFINCIQAMLTKTCSFKVPRCPERDVGPPRKAWRSTAVSLTDLSILEMLSLRSVFLLEPKKMVTKFGETSGLHISTVFTSCLVDSSCLLNMFASRLWWSCEIKKLQNRC